MQISIRLTRAAVAITTPSPWLRGMLIALLGWTALAGSARAQDLYDTTVLRNLALTFHDANWLSLLRANYDTGVYILADLEVEGITYPNVGVRIRGNTSYTALPAGSEKFSLKLKLDQVDPDQALFGYQTLNLNNGFHDPTFTREVVYNNYVAQFIPNPRANHVTVTLNGQNWGVYINVQQPNKRMLRDYFADDDGLRITCSNNPNGPGLAYNGPNASGYGAYEIDDDGGLTDPYAPLIAVANALSNGALSNWSTIDALFAVDPSIWSVVLENALTDDDSYVNKGCDFTTYRDPVDGRMHLLQRDANESFTANWSPTYNFNAANKPVLSRLLSVPELRQRYMSHYRTVLRDIDWNTLGPVFAAHRALIDAAVQADPKKLYSYTLFQNNFTSNVTLPYSGPAGGNLVGLQPFVTQRAATLGANAELAAAGPTISAAQASAVLPSPGQTVYVTATVAAAGAPVSGVELFYRPSPTGTYARVAMRDDGASGDGAAGDGVYGVALPVAGIAGQRVAWYVAATASNSYASVSYLPVLTERDPNTIEYVVGATAGLRITEWMYAGASGEFIEFTNLGDTPIDLTGWSIDDSNAVPGTFGIGALGTVAPGASVIVTDSTAEAFRSAWGLGPEVAILGELGVAGGNNLGRNDQIHLYDASGALVDRLYYGDETYPGTIRTQNASGQPPCGAIGANDVVAWQLSALGDAFGSVAASSGDLGTPGRYPLSCGGESIFTDGFD